MTLTPQFGPCRTGPFLHDDGMNQSDQRFHVIVLSNFAKGFDKYAFA